MKRNHLIKDILHYNSVIHKNQLKSTLHVRIVAGFITTAAFFALCIANLIEKNNLITILTGIGFILCLGSTLATLFSKNDSFVDHTLSLCCMVLFTIFTILGENQGFGSLWIAVIPFVTLHLLDMKFGFITSTYFLIFLFIFFWTPAKAILQFNYEQVFLIRFPLLYLTSYVLSIYICISSKSAQYRIIQNEMKLKYAEEHDKLTGLYNRNKYESLIKTSMPYYKQIGIIFLDINNLKSINDNYGHAAGDYIILKAAKAIKNVLTPEITACRIGGDEFVIIIENQNKQFCKNFLENWKQEMRKTNEEMKKFPCSVASGFAYASGNFVVTKVIHEADNEMYENKYMNKLLQKEITHKVN